MSPQAGAPYRDASLPVAERVADLLRRMTLEEKVAQLSGIWVYEILTNMRFADEKAKQRMGKGIGQITRIGGASNAPPVESARLANSIQKYLVEETRLGIPAIVHEECCSGLMALGATAFPQIIGSAATWEPELVEEMAAVIRAQMRAVGAHQGLAPVLDVTRDARWGRIEETFGEDAYLVASLGTAYVKGLQGENLATGLLATGKHFAAHGMPEGGMNWAPVHVGAREFAEVYLLPFEAAIKEGKLRSIMNAYHELDGKPCAGSKELLTDILRGQLGFDGVVVSDYFAINMLATYHHVARDKDEASAMAMEAGIEIELPSTDCYGEPLLRAVRNGLLSEDKVDEVTARVLRTKFELGLFERPYVDEGAVAAVYDTPEQRKLARTLAQKSIVLLKNDGNLLPLSKGVSRVAVIGPNADSVRNIIGDYSYASHIETLVAMRKRENTSFDTPVPDAMELVEKSVPMSTIRDGIAQKLGAAVQVQYARGCDVTNPFTEGFAEAVKLAKNSDVAIVVVGDKSGLTPGCTVGESRDRADVSLPGVQEELVKAIYETGTPTVVVLINGRPLSIPWLAEHIPAILVAWLPAEEGAGAIADVLFGDYNPGGKLPMTFPRTVGQVPIYYAHKPSGGRSHWSDNYADESTQPLYPFGFGLSYTTFEYANLRVTPAHTGAAGTVSISADITNTGQRVGEEVVQLYVHDAVATVTRAVKELKGFKRVALDPGQTRTVTFELAVGQLGFYDNDMRFVIEPGEIEVLLGSSSDDIRLSGSFVITGAVTDISKSKVFFSRARVD